MDIPLTYFQIVDPGKWYCPVTKMYIMGEILKYYQHILGAPRLPKSAEINMGKYKYQVFESAVIVYDPQHVHDRPWNGPCYLLQLTDPIIAALIPRASKP